MVSAPDPPEVTPLSQRSAAPADLFLRGARCLDPRAGIDGVHDVRVLEGRVAELAAPGSDPGDAEVVEAEGMLCLPAFVDPHVHLRTPGEEHKEDIETGTRAAAAGGYCAVIAMANTRPPIDSASLVTALRERAHVEAAVGVGFLACVTRGMAGEHLVEMAEIRDAGALGFSDDGLPIASSRVLRLALQYQRLAGGAIALHEEDPELSRWGHMAEGEVSAQLGLTGIPPLAESTMIARDAELAAYEDARIQIQHLSAGASVEAVAAAKARGVRITAEVTPHHLTLTDEAVRGLDPGFKMNPPLRTEQDRQALLEGLRAGTIDCVATDHAPHAAPDKEVPFEQAAMGVTGLETAFAVLHTELVLPGLLTLEVLVERMTAGGSPFGISPPTLTPGEVANLCLVDPEASWTVGEDGYESRSSNSCFAGRGLTGRILMTVAGGAVAYRLPAFAIGAA